MNENTFSIYQLKEGEETRDYRFEPYARLQSAELSVNRENYRLVYTAPLVASDTLGTLFERFNIDRPADFTGHSLSVSDVVSLCRTGEATAYYVDSIGFVKLESFLRPDEIEKAAPEVYKYYSTQRPVDIGTFPKTAGGPTEIVNFDKCESVEHGMFRAWGYLLYGAPLTEKQASDYELRAAPDNPDVKKRMEEQAQVIGQWEEKRKVPDNMRLTWWFPDFGVFVKKEFVSPEQMTERYSYAVESKAHATQKKAEKKPIAERLKEGSVQAEKDNAARPTPAKNTEKDR
jgi:hypothetical protein